MRLSKRVLLLAWGVFLTTLWPSARAAPALAHPLDEYLQALYVTLGSDGIGIELDLTPGVLVAPQVIGLIDADVDGQITEAEAQAYGRRVLDDMTVEIDQQPYRAALSKRSIRRC